MQHNKLPAVRQIMVWFLTITSTLCLPLAQAQTTVAGSMPGQFSVSESGAASYRIPIQVPPGVAGMQPRLELVYNSQGGNGLLGMGWSLSGLSAITRCPRTLASDGVRGAVNFDLNDRYCLDGQRLMLISGTEGTAGAEYRTERESYSQIKAYGSAGNGPAYWVVKTKAGLTMEYGNTEDSRIEAIKAAGSTASWPTSTVRAWAQNKVGDVKGNYYTVSYEEDSVNGEFYPSRVDYAGNTVAGSAPAYAVRFEPTATARLDVQTLHQAGAVIKVSKRIGNVKTYVGLTLTHDLRLEYPAQTSALEKSKISKLTQCDGVANCLPPTVLSWGSGGWGWGLAMGQSGLHGVGAAGKWFADINGDGRVDYVTKNNDDTHYWNFAAGPVALNYAWAAPQSQSGLHGVGTAGIWFIDINGDGLADYVTKNNDSTIHWNLSTGTGWGPNQSQSGLHGVGTAGIWFVDINGDGLADYVTKNNNGDGIISWNLSTGAGWGPMQSQSGLHGVGTAGIWFIDINGDGKADYVTKNNDSTIHWNLSTGEGWGPPQSQSGLHGVGTAGIWFVDINGDGLADYVTKNNNGDGIISWNLSTGAGWGPMQSQSGLHGVGTAGIWFIDINGDGKADYVTKNSDGTIHWNLSTGEGWGPPQSQSGLIGVGSAGIWFVDINGDGLPDYVTKYDNGTIYWDLNTFESAFLMSVTQVGDATVALTYKPITDSQVYTKDAAANGAVYPKVDLQYPMYVVSQATQSNGIGGGNTTQYKYGGLKAEMGTGRGLLGFRWMSRKELATGIERYTEYRQDFPYTGLPLKDETRLAGAGNAGVLKRNTNNVACQNPQTGAACTVAAGNRYFPHVTQSVEESWDLGGVSFPSIITSYVYGQSPQYGDPTQITVSISDGSSKTTVNEYWPADTGNWILGRLKRASVTSSQP